MAHIHGVFDSDTHFVIDPITRHLKNETSKKASVVQFDHDSERFTFELPRIIEGHDMTTCNVVQVHYLNIEAKTKKENKGLYEVDDLQISPEDENTVICSWLISQNATQLDGSISFLVRFSCVTEGEPKYIWQTAPYTAITVTTGIDNSDYIVEEYADILQQWKQELEELAASGGGLTEIPDDSITTAKIKDYAVTSEKLADYSIPAKKIVDGSVITAKIANRAVTGEKIAIKTISSGNLNDESIFNYHIANDTINGNKIRDKAISAAKIADKAITPEKLSETYLKDIPVTEADNGKFARVVNGVWAAETVPNFEGVEF